MTYPSIIIITKTLSIIYIHLVTSSQFHIHDAGVAGVEPAPYVPTLLHQYNHYSVSIANVFIPFVDNTASPNNYLI